MDQIDTILTKVEKLDERIRSLEKYLWVGIGCLGLLQFVAPYLIKLFGAMK